MPKYLLAVNFQPGVVDTPMEEWKPEEIKAHLDYYAALHEELSTAASWSESEVLTGPDLAKIVTSDGSARPWSPTGRSRSSRSGSPATRSSTSSRRRARSRSPRGSRPCPARTASRRSSRSRFGGSWTTRPATGRDGGVPRDGGRRALNLPPDVEDLLRELAPQVLGALVRRYGDFDAAEDAVQEALLAAAARWPAGRRPRQPARLAAPDRGAPADRPVAQRPVAPARERERGRRAAPLAQVQARTTRWPCSSCAAIRR